MAPVRPAAQRADHQQAKPLQVPGIRLQQQVGHIGYIRGAAESVSSYPHHAMEDGDRLEAEAADAEAATVFVKINGAAIRTVTVPGA